MLADTEEAKPVPLQIEKVFNGKKYPFYSKDWHNLLVFGDNLQILKTFNENKDPLVKNKIKGKVKLIYIDPPFNTGKIQARTQIRTERSAGGDRVGFAGQRYQTIPLGSKAYLDIHDDFLAFLEPRLVEAHRLLKTNGSIYFHIDYREVHYCKILLDGIFGRESFLNEIIWTYDYGARTRRKWPPTLDPILWYARESKNSTFNMDAIDRITSMSPGLVGHE